MYAIHETLLPASAIHHSLYLQHFTPSTIYDPPRPSSSRVQLGPQDVKIIGNLVVAGGSDLRVFEISEARVPVPELAENGDEGQSGEVDESAMEADVGDSFFAGPSKVCIFCLAPVECCLRA
jgi:cleavage and polyadenylation specificity factor subunit 1